jgi:hypothetical protein
LIVYGDCYEAVREKSRRESYVKEIQALSRHTFLSAFERPQKRNSHAKFISDISSIQLAP